MNFEGSRNIRSNSIAKLLTSKGRIEVRQIGDPLFHGLMLNQIHRMLSMNFGEMRIRNESSELVNSKGRIERIINNGQRLKQKARKRKIRRLILS